MHSVRVSIVVFFLISAVSAIAAAQPPAGSTPPADTRSVDALTPAQERELDQWISRMDTWLREEAKWANRPRRDAFGRFVARRPRPAAPSWLEGQCSAYAAMGLLDSEERLARACRLLADIDAGRESAAFQSRIVAQEQPEKRTSFLTRVHIDGLGTTASTQARSYGLVGAHVSLVDAGRLQIFGPPGVLLVSLPDGGGRRVTLGYHWGISVRLSDVRFADRDMTLFLNVSKVWVDGGRSLDLVGLSLAPRKGR